MEDVWLILALVSALVGIVGVIVPLLPGPPISYMALWMMWLRDHSCVSPVTLWVAGILMLLLAVVDYVAPIWLTKKVGCSKFSTFGATAGLVVGLFFAPWGIILGPFVGAFIGELINRATLRHALKVASMSFLSFLLTTTVKMFYCIACLIVIIVASL